MYLLITLICSGVYFFFRDGIDPCLENYREALYFSVVTGTTLGYGDFSPVGGIVRIAAGIQALSGPVLLAFYVSKSLHCLLYTSPSPRDRQKSRMPSSA